MTCQITSQNEAVEVYSEYDDDPMKRIRQKIAGHVCAKKKEREKAQHAQVMRKQWSKQVKPMAKELGRDKCPW